MVLGNIILKKGVNKMNYKIAEQFSEILGGRERKDGPYSGEAFRDDVLREMLDHSLQKKEKLIIDLDGTYGYPRSFLEESFGGLVRKYKYQPKDIINNIEFISTEEPSLPDLIKKYILEAK